MLEGNRWASEVLIHDLDLIHVKMKSIHAVFCICSTSIKKKKLGMGR